MILKNDELNSISTEQYKVSFLLLNEKSKIESKREPYIKKKFLLLKILSSADDWSFGCYSALRCYMYASNFAID